MINPDLINRYEFVGSTRENSYENLVDKFNFNELYKTNEHFKDKYFADNITKEGFGILFIEMKTLKTEINDTRDEITMHFTEKNTMVPKTDKPLLVCVKYEKAALFKFYGIYTIDKYTDKDVKLVEFNPSYYMNKDNVKMNYEFY